MPKRRANVASKRLRATARTHKPSQAVVTTGPRSVPAKPDALDGRAGEIWNTYAPELAASGMLTARDVLTFALWCQLGVQAEAGQLTGALITQFRLLSRDFGLCPSGTGRELAAIAPPAKPHKFFKD